MVIAESLLVKVFRRHRSIAGIPFSSKSALRASLVEFRRHTTITPATAFLVELAQRAAEELGFSVRDAATGGASDANLTAAVGVPTLDGLGPIGGLDHSPDEYLEVDSIVPRTAMLAHLITLVAENADELAQKAASNRRD